jgi:hypothetical protein
MHVLLMMPSDAGAAPSRVFVEGSCVATELAPHLVLRELVVGLESAKVPGVCHVVDKIALTFNGKNEQRKPADLVKGHRDSGVSG